MKASVLMRAILGAAMFVAGCMGWYRFAFQLMDAFGDANRAGAWADAALGAIGCVGAAIAIMAGFILMPDYGSAKVKG